MQELTQIAGFFAISAAVAYLATLLFVKWRQRRLLTCFTVGAPARMKTSGGVYRTRYAGMRSGRLGFTAPIQRDHFVPIGLGERVTIEVPMAGGVAIFRTHVVERCAESHEIYLQQPEKIRCQERREAVRQDARTKEIRVEDQAAWLCDLAPHGLRLVRDGVLRQGERIKVEIPSLDEPVYAWVLECSKNFERVMGTHMVRARFEKPLTLSLH